MVNSPLLGVTTQSDALAFGSCDGTLQTLISLCSGASYVAQLQRHVCDGVHPQTVRVVSAIVPIRVKWVAAERIGKGYDACARCRRQCRRNERRSVATVRPRVVARVQPVGDPDGRIAIHDNAKRTVRIPVSVRVDQGAPVTCVTAEVAEICVVPIPRDRDGRGTRIRGHLAEVLLTWFIVRPTTYYLRIQ
jgi:hypothetical protein